MPALIIHGHFYQPPRENPWTGLVEEEPTAQPFHDWNERVHAECYAPNVKNYEHLSFDFGPTLLSWLEREHPETYGRIISADVESRARHGGHGNAIAQAYSHAILPLCNQRDQRTQVRWGVADFRYRFKREPEALWLPETACNEAVMDLLIDEGMRLVILASAQAKGDVDTSIAYRYLHRDQSGRSLAVFFYDQELAGAIAFERVLTSSSGLADRLAAAKKGAGDLVNVATDGETYGHHFKFGDLCLAHGFETEFPARGFTIMNYGEYLDHHPAEVEVEINSGPDGEGSSWSCIHGVSRWIRHCGCSTGGEQGWNQHWRGPFRRALDFLRDTTAQHFEDTRGSLFVDPWRARDESIELILDPQKSRKEFLHQHTSNALRRDERDKALMWLEMQRQTILMYASCGWFFNDISGIEPVQLMKYAARAIDLMDQLGLPSPRERFLEILSEATSNRPEMGNGADIYLNQVEELAADLRG